MEGMRVRYKYHILSLVLGALLGWVFTPCNLPHVVESEVTAGIDRKPVKDSGSKTVVLADSGKTKTTGDKLANGDTKFRTRVNTDRGPLELDQTLTKDSTGKDVLETSWSYVFVQEVKYYFESYIDTKTFTKVQTVALPDTDDLMWFGIGGGTGVLLSIIAILLLL